MAELARIQFKRTDEKGKKPTADILESGELAINLKDQYLFTKDSAGNVINLSNPPVYEGDVDFTGLVKGQKAILGKTADYSSYEAQRDLSKFGAFRTNQMDGFDALILNVPHPSASLGNYAHGRGFEFQYGHVGNKVYTYGFNANGEKSFKFRMYHEGDKPSPSELNVYSKQDIDQRVSVSAGETKLRAPNQTNLLIAKDNKELIWYDGTTNQRMVNFGAGGMDLAHKLTDNVGINFYKKDGYRVKVETHAHSSSNMLAFSYKDSAGNNTHVINMPKANGLLATQEWVDSKYYKRGDSPTFNKTVTNHINIVGSGGGSSTEAYAQLSYESNEARWSYHHTDNTWKVLRHPKEAGIVATREWSDGRFVRADTTNLGKKQVPLTTIASGQWGKPIGYSVMVNSASPQRPPNTGYGYWHVIGARDTQGGYSGIWGAYNGGQMYYGQASTETSNPTWYKIYTEAQKPTPDELGAVNLGKGGNIRLHSYGSGGHGYSSWYENNARQAYIGFGSDGSKEFTINNEKSGGTINLKAGNILVNGATIASQNWCNSNFHTKANTYSRSEMDARYARKSSASMRLVWNGTADDRQLWQGETATCTENILGKTIYIIHNWGWNTQCIIPPVLNKTVMMTHPDGNYCILSATASNQIHCHALKDYIREIYVID